MNAMADAAAKAATAAPVRGRWQRRSDEGDVEASAVHTVTSDFDKANILLPQRERAIARVMLDRRLFTSARKRAARWTHLRLNEGLGKQYTCLSFQLEMDQARY